MKKRKTGRRTRKGNAEKELDKLIEALHLILACASWRRNSKSIIAYERYKKQLAALNLKPNIYEDCIKCISEIIGI
jgi:hypothetical protein